MTSHQQNSIDQKAATSLWKAVGGFGFLASLALGAAMSSEKIGPDLLKIVDSDPYAVTLFGIPILSGVLIAVAAIGRVYSLASQSRASWVARIPPIVEGVSDSSLRRPVNSVILIAFLLVPWFVLGAANVKFFHGTFYYAPDANAGCDEKNMSGSCEIMGSGWHHFVPKHGIGSLTDTHYRYQANKTYVPVLTPFFLIVLSILASSASIRFLVSLIRRAPGKHGDGFSKE